MKIVFSTDQLYLHGGIERILSEKIAMFSNRCGNEIFLITTEQKEKPLIYVENNSFTHVDLEINYNRDNSYRSIENIFRMIAHAVKLRAFIKTVGPDILVVCNYAPDYLFLPFIKRDTQIIKEFHSSGFDRPKKHWLRKVILRGFKSILGASKRFDAHVVLNKDEIGYYPTDFNISVIPNFVGSVSLKSSLAREKVILAAGRIAEVKQFDHLIRAWSIIHREYPDWTVVIYGDGDDELRHQLIILAKSLRINNIEIRDATSRLLYEMETSSIFALTSRTECFPMVLLEAMSRGLPILSYDCPNGPRNIISHGEDGLLVNNIEDFANSLALLIESPELRHNMSENCLRNVKRFEKKNIEKLWEELFINILK